MAVSIGFVVTQASTGILVALGLFLVWVRPRTRGSVAFGVALVTLSVGIFLQNFLVTGSLEEAPLLRLPVHTVVVGLLYLASGTALAVAAVSLPRPLAPDERRILRAAAVFPACGVLFFGAATSILVGPSSSALTVATVAFYEIGAGWAFGVTWGAGYLFVKRFTRTPATARGERAQYALMTAGLLPYLAFSAGIGLAEPHLLPLGVAYGLAVALLTALWLKAAARGKDGRLARAVALLLPASMLAGMVATVAAGGFFELDGTGVFAAIRLATFCLFAYAILRHRLFGLDLKLKWTVRRGTVVAVLAPVFFMLKEGVEFSMGASGFLPSVAAAAGIGLVATPVWRLAGRLADRILPGVEDTPAYRTARRRAIYRAALDSVARDGPVTVRERDLLAKLARDLGLTPGEARLIDGGTIHAT